MQTPNPNPGLMTSFEAEAHSFVVRLWVEGHDETRTSTEWRGWIEHVQNGQRRYFQDMAEIGPIVASHIVETSDASTGSQE